MKRILILGVALALSACMDMKESTQKMVFTQHKATGLCFAVQPETTDFTNVPCTPEVLAFVNDRPTAAPVTATENVR